MRARSDDQAVSLEVRALYSIAALARIANVTTFLLRRVLRANNVHFVRGGRALFVPLSEIRSKIPPLWESLRAAEALRHGRRTRSERVGPRGVGCDGAPGDPELRSTL